MARLPDFPRGNGGLSGRVDLTWLELEGPDVPTLDHRYSMRRLGAFVDDELRVADVDRVLAHLVDCRDCGAEVEFLLRVRAALAACEEMPESS